ncbi:hypothetical protein BG011_001264 [Mortierella polycephala]|uniref:Uncharacterized protein n=1 Tax=Mortierella polycephala TaxID=41804 RepID=A0A9P6U5C3_9FUNG|nr:hypothetical protein BG011_001264 [Mortierella polycephala]
MRSTILILAFLCLASALASFVGSVTLSPKPDYNVNLWTNIHIFIGLVSIICMLIVTKKQTALCGLVSRIILSILVFFVLNCFAVLQLVQAASRPMGDGILAMAPFMNSGLEIFMAFCLMIELYETRRQRIRIRLEKESMPQIPDVYLYQPPIALEGEMDKDDILPRYQRFTSSSQPATRIVDLANLEASSDQINHWSSQPSGTLPSYEVVTVDTPSMAYMASSSSRPIHY